MAGFVAEYIGDQLYYIGATLVRSRRNFFRHIRHSVSRAAKAVWKVIRRAFAIVAEYLSGVWADLSNPFKKGAKSVKGYRDMMAEIKDAPGRVKLGRIRAFFRYGFMWNGHLIERFMSHVLPVVCLALCVVVVKTIAELPYAIKVTANGQDIGFINNEAVYDQAVTTIKSRIIKVDDNNWQPSAVLTISVADADEINTQDIMANKILMASGMEVTEATGIYIGGQFYGATTAEHLLETTVDGIIEPFRKEAESMSGEVVVRFTRSVDLVSGIFPASSVVPYEELSALLTSEEEGPIYYKATEGENISDIAKNNGISVSKLKSLNPQADLNDTLLHSSQDLLVAENDFLMSVKTVSVERVVSSIGFSTINTLTSDYNLGYYKITQQGSTGEKVTVTEVEYKNGRVVSRTVVEETITKQPVNMYVVVGVGGSAGTNVYGGSIGWPTGTFQRITRGWIQGVHRGIDIAAAWGTPVYAAESGIVTVSADMEWDYGRYIIIDHGNGMQTVYGHMSSRVAQKGDYVSRGQLIGFVGSTGNSTGNHLHFEVRINGTRVPPEPYLYG